MKRQIQRVLLVLMLVVLMTTATSAQLLTTSSSSNDDSLTASSNIRVILLNQDPDPVEPGELVELRFKVENFGDREIQDVEFELIESFPFTLLNEKDRFKRVGDLGPSQTGDDSVIINWNVRVDDNAVAGEREIELRYKALNERAFVKFEPFTVNVETREAIVSIDDITVDPARPSPGNVIDVTVHLANEADSIIDDIKVALDLDETPFSVVDSTALKSIRRLVRDQEEAVQYKLAVDAEAESKVHQIPLTISYSDKSNQRKELDTSFGIIVDARPEYLVNVEDSQVATPQSSGEVILSVSNIAPAQMYYVTMELLASEQYKVLSNEQTYLGNLEPDDFETGEYNIFVTSVEDDIVTLKTKITYRDEYNTFFEDEIDVPMKVFSSGAAARYGLVNAQGGGFVSLLFSLAIAVPILFFWVFMLLDCWSKKKPKKLRIAWLVMIILANVGGAALYYFIGRKHLK